MKYKRNIIICVECGENKPKHTKTLCDKCYRKTYNQPKRICKKCGEKRKIKSRGFCNGCYKNERICEGCGLVREICSKNLCRNCYNKIKRKKDENFRIMTLLRQRVYKAFKDFGNGKIKKADEYGIDYEAIIEFLGPCPGENYHIDHIFPLSAFDFSDKNEVKLAFAPKNHQWLRSEDNLKKNCKYDIIKLEEYKNAKIH